MSYNIIGISAFYHNSACCLLQDGILTAASEEERYTRIKHDNALPVMAFMDCLERTNLSIRDIDLIAYYENPEKKMSRQLWSGYNPEDPGISELMDSNRPENSIRDILGYEGTIRFYEHHQSHAASSCLYSGFHESAFMTVDGVGEWSTTTYGVADGYRISILEEVEYPHSLGLLYATVTSYLGFRVNSGEYKVMGLAPYGKPLYVDALKQLLTERDGGQYQLHMEYFGFNENTTMYSNQLIKLFGQEPRQQESEIQPFHKDLAASLQVFLEEVLVRKANYLYHKTKIKNLCLAGGVVLNCVANSKIKEKTPFENVFINPAANDAGCALGAAALAYAAEKHALPEPIKHVYLGPAYASDDIKSLLLATGMIYHDYTQDCEQLFIECARLIGEGKVIGWFQGNMEFGPRALGNRSILADPRDPMMRDKINSMVKKREGFRPFAPAVLEEKAADHFDLQGQSPYMLFTCQVKSKLQLPAITHLDGSARIQTVNRQDNERFYRLIHAFDELTGCPILLNTSFNVRGEPIVMTHFDAIKCFMSSKIDVLVMNDYLVCRNENSFRLMSELVDDFYKQTTFYKKNLYTFL